MDSNSLIINPESFIFNDKELPELHRILADIDSHTLVLPVSGPNDLCINESGKTASGYGYTAGALVQLCGIIAPGLSQLVLDIAGQWRKAGEDLRNFSKTLAVEVLNRTIKIRCDRKLSGLQLVRNTQTKTIDGIVGSKYRYLANSDFLSRVEQECVNYKSKFHEACLYGRQFIVRYQVKNETPQYEIADEPYNVGYHFANSEIGGKAVRAATIIIRCSTGDCALSPFAAGTGGRVVHSGRDFEKRLHALMGHIIQKLPQQTEIDQGGEALEENLLQLGEATHEKRIRHIMQVLTRRKLTQNFARRVVLSAAAKGRNDEDTIIEALPGEKREILASRSGYDLFVALIREARRLPIDQREIAEQVAYALLVGKLSY